MSPLPSKIPEVWVGDMGEIAHQMPKPPWRHLFHSSHYSLSTSYSQYFILLIMVTFLEKLFFSAPNPSHTDLHKSLKTT